MSKVSTDRPRFVVDGLNVCRYKRPATTLTSLLTLLLELAPRDRSFICVFDGVTPHTLSEDERAIYLRLLSLLPDHLIEITGGIEADEFVLMQADAAGAQVISNDRFKKYAPRYQWVENPDRLIKGHVIRRELFLPALAVALPIRSDVAEAADELVTRLSEPPPALPQQVVKTNLQRYREMLQRAELQDIKAQD